MKPDITVVIPAYNRPDFLATLLASIQKQTVVGRIAEIVISEDGGSRESEKVAAQFPALPIRYIFRDPALGFLKAHKELLCTEARTPLTTLVHHDDWWSPNHLETACRALDNDADCAAFFANIYDSFGPQYPAEIKHHNGVWRAWLAAGCPSEAKVVRLDLTSVLLASLVEVTFHFSTMVGRSRAVAEAFVEVEATKNGYDCDRTFPVFLAERGTVSFAMTPSVFIRMHERQESRRIQAEQDALVIKSATTRWMFARWPHETPKAAARFNAIAATMEPAILSYISAMTGEPLKSCLIDEYGFNLTREQPPGLLKQLLKQFTPPVLAALLRRLASRAAK
jgi:hypothetical protein